MTARPAGRAPLGDWFAGELRRVVAARTRTKIGTPAPSFLDWALRIPEPKFGVLDFETFPYQRELYEEGHEDDEGVIQKCSQVGASAWMIRWAMFWPDIRGRTAIYLFPKEEQGRASRTSESAGDPGSPSTSGRGSRHDQINNVHERQIGTRFLQLRGSRSVRRWSRSTLTCWRWTSTTTSSRQNIPMAEKRVSGPLSLRKIRRIGFPTIPNFGISKKYDESDQRRWNGEVRVVQ